MWKLQPSGMTWYTGRHEKSRWWSEKRIWDREEEKERERGSREKSEGERTLSSALENSDLIFSYRSWPSKTSFPYPSDSRLRTNLYIPMRNEMNPMLVYIERIKVWQLGEVTTSYRYIWSSINDTWYYYRQFLALCNYANVFWICILRTIIVTF